MEVSGLERSSRELRDGRRDRVRQTRIAAEHSRCGSAVVLDLMSQNCDAAMVVFAKVNLSSSLFCKADSAHSPDFGLRYEKEEV